MVKEFDDITNILNELDKSLAEGDVPEGLITEILYLRLPDLKLSDEQKSSLNEKLKAALKKTELSEDLSDSLKTDFPDLYAALETAEEINEVADNAPADDKSDKPDENERAPQATDKRAQCIETIKQNILKPEQAPSNSATTLYLYMLNKQIDMKNALDDQKEIVAAAIKKIADTQPESPRLRLAYNLMMGTKTEIRNNEELKAAIARDFPSLAATTKAPKETAETKKTQSPPTSNVSVDTNATRTKRITALASATSDNIFEHLNNLRNIKLSNAPEDQKEIVAAAIKKVLEIQSTTKNTISHEKLKGIVTIYNALGKTKVTDSTKLESAIHSDFPSLTPAPKDDKHNDESEVNELNNVLSQVAETTNTPSNMDNIVKPDDTSHVNNSDSANEDVTEQTSAPTSVTNNNDGIAKFLRAEHISQIKQKILGEDEVYRNFATFLINHCLEDEKTKMNEASDDEKKVVAEAIQKVLIKHPKAQISRSGYSAMMGIPEPKNNRELLYAISRDFPSDSATSNTAEPNQTDTTTKLNDNLSGTKSSTDDVLPKGATDMSNDKKEDTSVYEDLRNLLINADRINPEELKRGITAAINAVISNPQLSDYEYNIIRDAVTKHANLLKEIAQNLSKEDRSAFKQALNNHTIKDQTIDVSSYNTALATISTLAGQDELPEGDIDALQNAIAVIGSQNINTPELLNTLKSINDKFPKEFKQACQAQFAEDKLPTKDFTSLYKDVTNEDFPVSAIPTQEDANELNATLRNVAETLQKEEDERARAAIEKEKEKEKEQERQAKIRAEREEEERKARLEADFTRAWNATSASDYVIKFLSDEADYLKNKYEDDQINKLQSLTEDDLSFLNTGPNNPQEKIALFMNLLEDKKIFTTEQCNNYEYSKALTDAVYRGILVATEKATPRWAHISRLSADPNVVIPSGIEPDKIANFSFKNYLNDNFEKNSILVSFMSTEQLKELQDITKKINNSEDLQDLQSLFKTKMAQSKLTFSRASQDAVLDIARRAEELHKHKIELKKQRQAEEAKRQAEENRFLYSLSAADYIMRCLTDNKDLKDALNLTDTQRNTVIDTAFDVGVARSLTTTSTDFSEDFIEKLKEKDPSLTDEQLGKLTDLAKRANEVEKRVLKEEAEAEAKNNEYRNLSDKLYKSTNFKEYLASIEPLLGAEALKNAMALEQPTAPAGAEYNACAKALDNPDWLIALKMYHPDLKDTDDSLLDYQKDWMNLSDKPLPEDRKTTWQKLTQKNKTDDKKLSKDASEEKDRIEKDINGIIKARLRTLDTADITPENAYAWLYLAQDKALDTALKDQIKRRVGEALYNYDQEHFGDKNDVDLLANYNTATKEIEAFIKDSEKAESIIGKYYFTNDKNGALSAKKERQIKESVLEVAAELVAEDFAKNPLTGTNKEKADAIEKALKNKVAMLTCGQKRLTETQAIASMAANMCTAETFKDRIKTKFKSSTLYNNVNSRLTALDKKLTKRYGKKYITAKKVCKFAAKTGWNVTKGVTMFAVANAVLPGVGPATLIAYNTAKQWKSVKAQLSDPSISKAQKAAILLGSGTVAALSIVTAASGLAPDQFGINTNNISNAMSTLTGRIARVGAITLGNTLPNMVKGLGLRIKTKTLEKRIKDKSQKLKADAKNAKLQKEMKELLEAYQSLQKQKAQNKQEMIEKAASAALGGGLGTMFGSSIQNLVNGAIHAGTTTVASAVNDVVPETEPAPAPAAKPEIKAEPVDTLQDEAKTDSIKPTQFSATEEAQSDTTDIKQSLADKVAAAQRAEAGDTTQTSAPTQASNETETKSETESKAETKAETKAEEKSEAKAEAKAETENKQPEAKVAEQHAKNLEAAKVESTSGHGNLSAYQDTIRHLTNLGDSRFEDINATAQQLAEHFGDKSNMALIASLMDPKDVYEALGFNGTDTPLTSHEMINYLANHDLTPEQQTNLNHVLEDKFGNWYSNAETHGVAPTSHTGDNNDNNTNQGNTGAKEAAEGGKTNATAEATAKAAATAAATAAADQAAATTKAGAEQTTGAEFHKMDVAPTGDKTVDTLNAKYAVTNGLEGGAKISMKFEKLSEADAALLGQRHDDSQPAQQQQQHQQQEQHPKGHATVEHRQTAHQQAQQRDDIPVEAAIPLVYGSAEWAVQQGYVIDWDLTRGLNHGGTINHGGLLSNHGYAAVYFNPHDPNDVLLIPNDPIADRDLVKFESRQVLRTLQNANNGHGAGPYERSNNPFGLLTTVLRGSGHISTATSTEAKIMSRVAMGAAVLDGVHSILGHHHHKG